MLRDREYNAASVLNNLPPMSSPLAVAERAGELARRRRIGKIAVFISGAALAVTIWTAVFVTGFGRSMMGIERRESLRTETIPLTCLSPEQAADIINPYVRSRGSTYYIGSSGVPAITVRGTPAELAKSYELIRQFESDPLSCHTPLAEKLRELQRAMGAMDAAAAAEKAAAGAEAAAAGAAAAAPVVAPAPAKAPAAKNK